MFKVHHGLQDMTNAPTIEDALAAAKMMLSAGLTNVLITRADVEVTGEVDCNEWHDGRIGTLVLNIPIKV